MKKLSSIIFLCLVVFPTVAQLTGKVVGIADGDTFTLVTEKNESVRVRLHGIDCPEKSQDFGRVAKTFLSNLIYNKTVTVKKMDVDRYGRVIGIVLVRGVNINEEILEAGLAWHYTQYDQNQNWAAIERSAKKAKKGLWQRTDAVAPWEYRRIKKLARANSSRSVK